MNNIRVTGSIQSKTTKKGNTYLYMVLTINGGSPKWEATGLLETGNIRKAETMLRHRIHELEQQLEKKSLEEEKNAKLTIAEKTMFHTWMIQYIRSLKNAVRESTMEGYECRLKHIIDYYNKEPVSLADLTAKDLDDFFQYLLRYGKKDQKTGEYKPLAVRTVRAIKALIVSALNQAVILGYIDNNPCLSIKIGSKSNSELARKFHFMKVKELNQLLDYMTAENDPLTDIVKVISHYGLRRSEALAITLGPNSLDLENRRLHITRTIVKVKNVHDEMNTKTQSSAREFYIIDEMYDLFKRILAKKEENKKFYGNTYCESDFLFTWEDGVPFNPDYLYHHFGIVMKKFGRPDFTLHNLRHSCASYLYEAGWREWDIAAWLGHEDPSTTRVWYAVLTKAYNDEKAKSLEGLLNIN